MGTRFRKSIKLGKGVKLNIGKKSASISLGTKGLHTTFSTTGRKTTSAGIPGTGLSYTKTVGSGHKTNHNVTQKSTSNNNTIADERPIQNNFNATCILCNDTIDDKSLLLLDRTYICKECFDNAGGYKTIIPQKMSSADARKAVYEYRVNENHKIQNGGRVKTEISGEKQSAKAVGCGCFMMLVALMAFWAMIGAFTSKNDKTETTTEVTTTVQTETTTETTTTTTTTTEATTVAVAQTAAPAQTTDSTQYVYIGSSGNRYHYESCPTLKGKGIKVTLAEAKAQDKTPCGVCYR
jgi:hypothetical protein